MPSKQAKIIQVNATKAAVINTDKCATIRFKRQDMSTTIVSTKSAVMSKSEDQTQNGEKVIDDEDLPNDASKFKHNKCDIAVNGVINMNTNERGKLRKGKKKKNKKKEKDLERTDSNCVGNKNLANVKLPPLPKKVPAVNNKNETSTSTGCFGFVTSWLRKRMEKRREKKRQAIRARFSKSMMAKLKEYEHKKSRGGVAFTVEIDNRPMRKPLLPPIKTKSGPIKLGHTDKMVHAEKMRKEQLEKRVRFAGTQEEKRVENAERKADNEKGFKQKAELTILAKQGQARRNQSRLEMSRRSASSMRRTPSRAASRLDTDDELNEIKYLE